MIGAVDSLGKNLKINTYDGKIWYPTFYDIDTCLGIDNSGYLTIQPDVEIESGSFNTSNSNLWSKVWNYFNAELKEEWAVMRQGNFTLDNLMKYLYGEQISKIPPKLYNDDSQVKYLDFGSLYTYCCHGDKEHLMRRWLRERIAYVDSMLGYFTSQEDQVTIRMNKSGYVEFEVTPYIPLYFSIKWSNATGGTQTYKLKRGETKTFHYTSTTSTDQEVIIYHAKHIKKLDNLSNLNPSSCILSNATKLTNVEIHSELLYNINVTNNNYLRKLNLRGCKALGTVTATGSSLDLTNCKYLQTVDVYDTALTEVNLNSSGGSLTEIYYPKTIQSLNLIKQGLLEIIGLPYGTNGNEVPTALYTINIQDCPSITQLNTSSNADIRKSFASMVYCNNLTIRNSLDLETLNFDGFYRLRNVVLENMYKLANLGFDNMLPVGEVSTIRYIGVSNCPNLTALNMNCTSNNYEITLANDSILNFGKANSLKTISSNCVLKGLKTLIVPKSLESMFFTTDYGSGYSSVENIWSGEVCSVNTDGTTPTVTHVINGYKGIDFAGLSLKNIDLGALVNIPDAINFSLSPTTVNPNFNKNRDGVEYPYLQPTGILDLSNYTESLARFFDGVDLDKLKIICNNNLPQTDLSYCFYNSTFSSTNSIKVLLSQVSSITNLDYCFYKTSISDISVLGEIHMGANSTMNYMFGECKNINSINSIGISRSVTSVEGMFSKCSVTTVTNLTVNVQGSISSIFKDCNKLVTVTNFKIPNATDVSGIFENCTNLTYLTGFELPESCNNIDNLFNGCYNLYELSMDFGINITSAEEWYPPNLETLSNTTIKNNSVKLSNCNTIKNINRLELSGSDISGFFEGCSALKNVNGISIKGEISSISGLFRDIQLDFITNVELSGNITDLSYSFYNCSGVTDDTVFTIQNTVNENVNYRAMFAYCSKITKIFDSVVPSVGSNISYMYAQCKNLSSINNLYINSSTCTGMFDGCSGLIRVIGLKLDGVKNTELMFNSCTAVTEIQFDITGNTTSLTRTNNMFSSCYAMESTNFDKMNLSEVIEFHQTFINCFKLQKQSLQISDKCTTIYGIFAGCSSLEDISGMTIGSKVTSAGNWIYNCSSLKYANNMVINSKVTFYNCTSLLECKNLVYTNSDTLQLFGLCSKLTTVEGLTLTNPITMGANAHGEGGDMFRGCNTLSEIDFVKCNLDNVKDIAFLCYNSGSAKTIKNFKFPSTLTASVGSFATRGITFENLTIDTNHKVFKSGYSRRPVIMRNTIITSNVTDLSEYFKNTSGGSTVTINEFSIDYNKSDLSNLLYVNGMFEGRTITSDFLFPASVVNAEGCFKDCSKITHVHSNWDNEYSSYILSTDCYSGCTGITHIDGIDLGVNQYVSGLDEVPESWGGYEFNDGRTTILTVEIPNDNYTIVLSDRGSRDLFGSGAIIWGDGNISLNEVSHTYSKAGTYVIKGKYWVYNYRQNYGEVLANYHECVTEINKVPSTQSVIGYFGFYNCKKLSYANINEGLFSSLVGMFESSNVQIVDFYNVKCTGGIRCIFYYATKLEIINGLETFDTTLSSSYEFDRVFCYCSSLTSVKGIEKWNVTYMGSLLGFFQSCRSLTGVLDLSNWNLGRCTSTNLMFSGCSNLEEIKLPNNLLSKQISNVESMFNECNNIKTLNVTNLVTSYTQKASLIFKNCYKLSDVIGLDTWDTINCTTMHEMFRSCIISNFSGIYNWDVSKVVQTYYMFSDTFIKDIDINMLNNNWNIKSLKQAYNMFYQCNNIVQVDLSKWNYSSMEYMSNMFGNCENLEKIIYGDLRYMENYECNYTRNMYTIQNCPKLNYVNLVLPSNTSGRHNAMFNGSSNLTYYNGINVENIRNFVDYQQEQDTTLQNNLLHYVVNSGVSLNVDFRLYGVIDDYVINTVLNLFMYNGSQTHSFFRSLSQATLVNIIDLLYDYSNEIGYHELNLTSYNIVKLTDEQISIATNKGWTVI